MNNRIKKIGFILMLAGLLFVLWHWQYAVGYEIGCLTSILLYKRNEIYWNDVMDMGNSHKGKGLFHFMINYALMALVMVLGVLFPNYSNIYTTALGLTLIKMAIILNEVIPGKEERIE